MKLLGNRHTGLGLSQKRGEGTTIFDLARHSSHRKADHHKARAAEEDSHKVVPAVS